MRACWALLTGLRSLFVPSPPPETASAAYPGDGLPPDRSVLLPGWVTEGQRGPARAGFRSLDPRESAVSPTVRSPGRTDAVSLSAAEQSVHGAPRSGALTFKARCSTCALCRVRRPASNSPTSSSKCSPTSPKGWRPRRSPSASTCLRMSCTGWSHGCSTSSSQRQAGTRCATSMHATAGRPATSAELEEFGHRYGPSLPPDGEG